MGRSILRPLSRNIFLCDLFLLMRDVDIAIYGDDDTPCILGDNIDQATSDLQNAAASLFKWFSDNQMIATNPKKFRSLINESCKMIVGNIIKNSKCEKLLRIKVDRKLSFKADKEYLCKKASRKIYTLVRITPYMDLP